MNEPLEAAVQQGLLEMATQLRAKTGKEYTSITAEITIPGLTNDFSFKLRAYQNITSWTDEYSTWEAVLEQATAKEFRKKAMLADAEAKEREAAEIRKRIEAL